jgi:hypothetical protein
MPCIKIGNGILTVAGPTLKLAGCYFEMHNYCGPMKVGKHGGSVNPDFPSKFWGPFERWHKTGMRVDAVGNCIITRVESTAESPKS